MNSAYSRKKGIKIVLIQGRNEYGLFGEEMNSVYSVKVPKGNECCLFRKEMNSSY